MSEAALFPRKLLSHLYFFYVCIPFYVQSGSKSGIGTGMHCGFGSAEAKGSGSGSPTLASGKECAMIAGGGGGGTEENEKASASSKLFPLTFWYESGTSTRSST
jgi:hypothetical protein